MEINRAVIALLAVGVLFGCGQRPEGNAAGEFAGEVEAAAYRIELEREVLVDLNDDSSETQNLTEKLAMDYHIEPAELSSAHDGQGYTVSFGNILVDRVDFVQKAEMADVLEKLEGQSFTIFVDSNGRISQAENMLEYLTELAKESCAACEQGSGCGHVARRRDFLMDAWVAQELLFKTFTAINEIAGQGQWSSARQVPGVLGIDRPSVNMEWQLKEHDDQVLVVSAREVLYPDAEHNSLPAIYSENMRLDGLLGFLRNGSYDSAEGNIVVRINGTSNMPAEISRESVIQATAYYILSRRPRQSAIVVLEKMNFVKL